ncbi:orotate phosphoribosyltransferase [Lachnospiraceae bacterium ZAX-1]
MEDRMVKFYAKDSNQVALHAVAGHFATSHSHINYYIDMTSLKTRAKEALEVAKVMAAKYQNALTIDTIVCMDGTEVIGAFLAQEFERRTYMRTTNLHETIYIVSPEFNSNNQMIFRDNTIRSIYKKHILLLLATTTTGVTIQRSLECIAYYDGIVEGVASLFSTVEKIEDTKVESIFTADDLPGYGAYKQKDCPYCNKGHKLEAMVNSFGYSKL